MWAQVSVTNSAISDYTGEHLALWVSPTDPTLVLWGGDVIDPTTVALVANPTGISYNGENKLDYNNRIHSDNWAFAACTPNSGNPITDVWVGTDDGIFRLDGINNMAILHGIKTSFVSTGISASLIGQSINNGGDVSVKGEIGVGIWDNGVFVRNVSGVWTPMYKGMYPVTGDGTEFSYSPDGNSYFYSVDMGGTRGFQITHSSISVNGPHGPGDDLSSFGVIGAMDDVFEIANNVNYNGQIGAVQFRNHVVQWSPIWGPYSSITDQASLDANSIVFNGVGGPRGFATDPLNPNIVLEGANDGSNNAAVYLLNTNAPNSVSELLHVAAPGSPSGNCGGVQYTLGGDFVNDDTHPDEVRQIAFDPVKSGKAYITLLRGGDGASKKYAKIWTTENYLASTPTWTPIACQETGFPDLMVNALAVDPQNGKVIFAGTRLGLYVSVDGGVSWGRYLGNGSWSTDNIGPANVEVKGIKIMGRKIYLFTWGRGVWVGTLPDVPTASITTSPSGPQNFTPQTYSIAATSPSGTIASVKVYINGILSNTVNVPPWTASLPVSAQSTGVNNIQIVVTDSYGLTTTLNSSFTNPIRNFLPAWIDQVLPLNELLSNSSPVMMNGEDEEFTVPPLGTWAWTSTTIGISPLDGLSLSGTLTCNGQSYPLSGWSGQIQIPNASHLPVNLHLNFPTSRAVQLQTWEN